MPMSNGKGGLGEGSSDGYHQVNHKYVPLSYDDQPKSVSRPSKTSKSQSNKKTPKPYSYEELRDYDGPPPSLRLGEKIVWISDNGPEFGVVKWLGRLPDVDEECWMAGVEFKNPVGSGTGYYNEHKLFEAKMNHASLVPIVGLLKAADYLGLSGKAEEIVDVQQPPPLKPRRGKKAVESCKFYTAIDSSSEEHKVGVSTLSPELSKMNIRNQNTIPTESSGLFLNKYVLFSYFFY